MEEQEVDAYVPTGERDADGVDMVKKVRKKVKVKTGSDRKKNKKAFDKSGDILASLY